MRLNGCPIAKPTLTNESTCFYAGQVKQDSVEKSFKRKLEIIEGWDHPRTDVGYSPTKFVSSKIKIKSNIKIMPEKERKS